MFRTLKMHSKIFSGNFCYFLLSTLLVHVNKIIYNGISCIQIPITRRPPSVSKSCEYFERFILTFSIYGLATTLRKVSNNSQFNQICIIQIKMLMSKAYLTLKLLQSLEDRKLNMTRKWSLQILRTVLAIKIRMFDIFIVNNVFSKNFKFFLFLLTKKCKENSMNIPIINRCFFTE